MVRYVVGVDGSAGSVRALEWAIREARLHGASIDAVHAWRNDYHYFSASPFASALSVVSIDTLEHTARRTLDDTLGRVDTTGVPVEGVLVEGGPARELLDAAKGADLLVVGTHGRGGFTGMLLGSTSQHVTHHATCPVVLVPDEP